MKALKFERLPITSVRVATQYPVKNDLSLVVDNVRVYDPRVVRDTVTSAQLTEPVDEGATIRMEAAKLSGANYRLSPWEAAVTIAGERVFMLGGGFITGDTAGADGYYPMGNFIVPTVINVEMPPDESTAPHRLVFRFRSGLIRDDLVLQPASRLRAEYVHQLRDRVESVWMLEPGERLVSLPRVAPSQPHLLPPR